MGGNSNSLQYLIWLKSKTVKIYSVVQSVKLLLVLSISEKIYLDAYLCTFMVVGESSFIFHSECSRH